MRFTRPLLILSLIAFAVGAQAATLAEVQKGWVEAKYHTPDKATQGKAFDQLAADAHEVAAGGDGESQVWEAVVLASRAKFIGGTSALDDIRSAKNLLEKALKSDAPSVKNGYANALLGALYGKAPGWPISFGDTGKAKDHFAKATTLGPDNIDVNTLHGEFLHEQGKDDEARAALEKAVAAAPRKGKAAADAGRRAEAQATLDMLK